MLRDSHIIRNLVIAVFLLAGGTLKSTAQTACFTAVSDTACIDLATFAFNAGCSSGAVSYLWNAGDGLQSGTNPTATFNYFSSGPGTYTVSLNVCDGPNQSGNCDLFTMDITVYPLPTASFTIVGNTTGCGPFEVCFTDNSTTPGGTITNWLWDFGNGASNATNTPTPCYIYPSTTIGTFPVTLSVVDEHGCADDTVNTATAIDNHAGPSANFTFSPGFGSISACNPGDTVTFTDATITGDGIITQWDWNLGVGAPVSGNPVSVVYTAAGTYTVQLTITDEFGCTDSVTKVIQVDDFQSSIGFVPVYFDDCGSMTVQFLDTSSTLSPNTSYNWDFDYDGSTFVSGSTLGPPFVQHTYTVPGTYTVAMVVTNAAGCTDTVFTQGALVLHPLPNVGFTVDTTTSCNLPFDVTFTDTTGGAASWSWDLNNYAPAPDPDGYDWSTDNVTQSFTYTYNDTGCFNVSIRVIDTNGCRDSIVIDDLICVFPPFAGFTGDTLLDTANLSGGAPKGCVPLKVYFADLSTYDNPLLDDSIVTWYWDFGDGYTIIGGDSAIPDSTNDCLTSCTYPNPEHIYVDTGAFEVTLVVTTSLGCTDTLAVPDFVNVGMIPYIEFTVDDTVGCHPFEVEFQAMTSDFVDGWEWDFGDGGTNNTDSMPPYTYEQGLGYFDVWLQVEFKGCKSPKLQKDSMIEVLGPKPLFNVRVYTATGISNAAVLCPADTQITGGWKVEVRDSSLGYPHAWLWNMGDTNTTYSTDTIFEIVYDTLVIDADTAVFPVDTFFFQAGDTLCDTVFYVINPGDTIIRPDTMIPPDTLSVMMHLQGDVFFWPGMPIDTVINIVDDTTITYTYCITPVLDTVIDSTFTIFMSELYDTTFADTFNYGCASQVDISFEVDYSPAYIKITPHWQDTLYYVPHDAVVIDTTQIPVQPDPTCFTVEDTLISTTPNQVVVGPDTFNITWSIITIDTLVSIVLADTMFLQIDTVDTSSTPITENITPAQTVPTGFCGDSTIIPADTTYDPPFKTVFDTLHPKAFFYTYHTPGPKEIWLYTWRVCPSCPDSLCLDSVKQDIYISPWGFPGGPVPAFTITPGSTACDDPATFVFSDTTGIDQFNGDLQGRVWDFGDGQILISPFFPNQNIGLPVGGNNPPLNPTLCLPGGSVVGSYQTVSHTYCDPGTYTVKLLLFDRGLCRDSVMKEITIYPNQTAQLVADTMIGCAGDPFKDNLVVTFTDIGNYGSDKIDNWLWNFGDGTPLITTFIPVVTHEYTTCSGPSGFNASVTITDQFGCGDPSSAVQIVTNCPSAVLTGPTTTCSGNAATYTSTNLAEQYIWDWCDGSPNDTSYGVGGLNQSHTYIVDSTTTFRITLTITDAIGCKDTTSLVVTISQPIANFGGYSIDIDPNCPKIFEFADSSSTDVIDWSWNFGNGTSPLAPPVSNTYEDPGLYDVSLIVTSLVNGVICYDTIVREDYILIKGPLLISQSSTTNSLCAPYHVTFTATGLNTDTYTWVFGDGNDTTVSLNADPLNPVTSTVTIEHIYTVGGTFVPVLIIEDPADSSGVVCPFQFVLSPIIVPGPEIGFMEFDTICGPRSVSFIDTSTGGADFDLYWWNFGDGNALPPGSGNIPVGTNNGLTEGTYTNPVHFFEEPGQFEVVFGGYVIDEVLQDTCFYQTLPDTIVVFGMNLTDYEECPPLFVAYDTSGITVPTSILPYNFDELIWDFGDGSDSVVGATVTHIYGVPNPPDSVNTTWYDITVTFSATCSFVAGQAGVKATPTADFVIEPSVSGISLFVSLLNTSSGANASVTWDFDDNTPSETHVPPHNGNTAHSYIDSGSYDIELIACNLGGCCDTIVKPKHILIKIPNVFNPGSGTAENSVFYIGDFFADSLDLSDAVLRLDVYNRWGEVVYTNEHYEECDPQGAPELCWDGHDNKGNELGTDTYFYVLSLNDQAAVNGYVMLLRQN